MKALKYFFIVGCLILFSGSKNPGRQIHLIILHTNDTHSQIESIETNQGKVGGYALRAAYIKKIRQKNPHVLLFDAGDFMQGTPYYNMYKGKIEIELMNKLGYQAITLGNHEFDSGQDTLVKVLRNNLIPIICSNYTFTKISPLYSKTYPYYIISEDGITIGVFGLGVSPEGLINPAFCKGLIYQSPIEVAQKTADILRNQKKCDIVICLSHLGYQYEDERISDIRLAAATSGIDIIIGGHTHSNIPNGKKIKNKLNKDVLITQAGYNGNNIGRIDLFLSNI